MSAEAVVMGLGITGMSCLRHLHARGYALTAMDSREQPPQLDACRREFPDATLITGGFDPEPLERASLIAVSPGIPGDDPLLERARQRGADVAGDVELFAREARGRLAAITGTNGKSTVTSLVGAILQGVGRDVGVGGNLGTPALDLLAGQPADGFVLELSSFQLELLRRLDLDCAAVLNVSADHLDRYADLATYAAVKRRIYAHAGAAVYNADDPLTTPPPEFAGERIPVHPAGGPEQMRWGVADIDGEPWLMADGRALIRIDELPLAGRHNAFNVAASLAVAQVLGVEPRLALPHVRAFRGLAHRCVEVGRHGGVRYVDDSKATNIGAVIAAVEGLDDGRAALVVIAGGQGKGQDFAALREPFARHVEAAVLIGEDADLLAAGLGDACAVERAIDMGEAVRRASRLAGDGGTVVLAPACASFDMFESYVDRGQAFERAVAALAADGGSAGEDVA